jgi:hypothetical protein
MPTTTRETTEAAIWERVIHPQGKMSTAAARQIVQLQLSNDQQSRMHELATKNQSGTLTPEEESELDNFCRVGTMLSILQSRARQVLKPRRRVS